MCEASFYVCESLCLLLLYKLTGLKNMKLITAIKMIEEREKQKRKTEKEMRRNGMLLKNNNINKDNQNSLLKEENELKNLVHVQSIFPQDDIVALKVKTREAHVREAISKAVYYYLRFAKEDRS